MKRSQTVVLTILSACAVMTAPFAHAERGSIKTVRSGRENAQPDRSNYYFSTAETLRTKDGPYRIQFISSGHQVPVRRDGGRVVYKKMPDGGEKSLVRVKVDQGGYSSSRKILVTLPDGRSIEATDAQNSNVWGSMWTFLPMNPTGAVLLVAQINTPAKLTVNEFEHLIGVMVKVQETINRDNEKIAKSRAEKTSAIVNGMAENFKKE